MSVQMKISGLMIDPVSQMPIVILKDASGEQVLPIWVGVFEANAIATQMEKIVSPRPMTHDLLKSVIEELKARVERIDAADFANFGYDFEDGPPRRNPVGPMPVGAG